MNPWTEAAIGQNPSKIIQELAGSGNGQFTSVTLKTMSFFEGRNHHLKPAQPFTNHKFSLERMRRIYGYIKFMKKTLHLDLSSYWVKKELMKTEYQSILDSCTEGIQSVADKDDLAVAQILMQPEFLTKLDDKINYERTQEMGYVCKK